MCGVAATVLGTSSLPGQNPLYLRELRGGVFIDFSKDKPGPRIFLVWYKTQSASAFFTLEL